MRHGQGICFYGDGSVYKGSWFDGQWGGVGNGILRTVNGEILFGQFTAEKGHLKDHSWAQIKYANGDVYMGNIVKGKKQGRGSYYYRNGEIYEGDWDDNIRHGKGSLICKKGNQCRGEFNKDEFISGIYYDEKGSKY